MKTLTVRSNIIAIPPRAGLTPHAMTVIYEIAAFVDETRQRDSDNGIWINIPTARLRGPDGRTDNHHLKKTLKKLTEYYFGEDRPGSEWGAVMLAEWHLIETGSVARLLIAPTALRMLKSQGTFAKIEAEAMHRLPQHARRLYALLADHKRQDRANSITWSLEEFHALMGSGDKKAYERWGNLKSWVIDPAINAINDFGTVRVEMKPIKTGRSVTDIQFTWNWKAPDAAAETSAENDRHSRARRKKQETDDAPPMIEDPAPQLIPDADELDAENAHSWWARLTQTQRDQWAEKIGRITDYGRGPEPRHELHIKQQAFQQWKAETRPV